jgi:hypothetical protein
MLMAVSRATFLPCPRGEDLGDNASRHSQRSRAALSGTRTHGAVSSLHHRPSGLLALGENPKLVTIGVSNDPSH